MARDAAGHVVMFLTDAPANPASLIKSRLSIFLITFPQKKTM
jgi:hypothetical protein